MLIKLWKILSSRNVAIVLLVIVTGMLLLTGLLPNPNFMGKEEAEKLKQDNPLLYFLAERFNTQTVARGYIFGFASVFLIISTTACSIDRFFERRKLKRAPLTELPAREFDISFKLGDREDFFRRLKTVLRLKRWSVREAEEKGQYMVLAEKGMIGFWGSVFFHAVLITVLIGAAIYYFTAFYATLLFTEGQSKVLSEQNLEKIDRKPLFGVQLPKLRFTLEHFYSVYWRDEEPVEYTSKFLIEDLEKGNKWRQTVRINEPFRYGGIDFLMVFYGFSPNFIVYKDGRKIFDSYVALSVTGGREDSFNLPYEDLMIRCVFFPDFREGEEGYYSASPLPREPVFLVNVTKGGKSLYKGLIPLGQEVSAGEYTIRFNDLRYWITLNLVKETGMGFFFWSSMFGLIGLLVRFLDPDRKIFFLYKEDMLSVVSYSRHYEGILKEQTKELVENLTAEGKVKADV
jgi:hypothetical protein